MIVGLDSSADRPTAAIADAARAAGIGLWSGYIATKPGVNLFSVWAQSDFDNARRCGGTPIGFCSGLDDPVALKALAVSWNVRLCLDVEGGIRPDGPWVQPWLDASGAGLYGVCSVHNSRSAAFHVLALYPGFDPGATWSVGCPLPGGPLGWQWQGSHTEFGLSVDRAWYDDWFGGQTPMTDQEVTALFADWYVVYAGRFPNDADIAEIQNHWLPAWRADPFQARFDFGQAAAAEVGGKDVRPVRHFELPPSGP